MRLVYRLDYKKYKIKGIEDNDELLYLGKLFRPPNKADWYIQVRFKNSEIKSVLASLIPDLAVGQQYNRTENAQSPTQITTFAWRKIVGNKSGVDLQLPPVDGIKRFERYLIVETNKGYVAIPQLELARILFLQNSKTFHYALEPTSLAIDFYTFTPDSENLIVQVNPTAQLTKGQFERIFNANKFAYTLADKAGRKAFLSINENFLKYRKSIKGKTASNRDTYTTWWTFGFDAPTLHGCVLSAKVLKYGGIFGQNPIQIVSEITSLSKVPHSLPETIRFVSRDWLTTTVKKSDDTKREEGSTPELYEIDDEQSASTFLPARIVESKSSSEFSLEPSRSANTLTKSGKIRLVVNDTEREVSGSDIASTDLPDILGLAVPVSTSSNTSDMADVSVFDKFREMVNIIAQKPHFALAGFETKQLSKVGHSRVHLKKPNKAPRLAAIAHLRDTSTLESFTLIEIDLSDYIAGDNCSKDTKHLSTLLFKYGCLDEARSRVDPILLSLVDNSLNWPREFLTKNKIKSAFARHPPSLSSLPFSMSKQLIIKWANDTIKTINRI